ncbi:MAG TPA: acetylglutamate kinase [Dehalococcoidia bacterium]|nr:acetylglutamate kinase [Dehalococcoidia bacterium]
MSDLVVVKIGGSTLGQHDTAMEDIAALQQAGRPLVVVHGGGSSATEWLKVHGVTSEFVDGLRVTGPDAIDVVVAVFAGLVNKQIVAGLSALGARPFGLSGVDGGLMCTRQLDSRLGFVGEVTRVDCTPINALRAAGYMPVISSVGFWGEQPTKLMNVNADTVAGEVAAALGATDLVFLTDVAHVRGAEGQDLHELRAGDVEALIASGTASGGMIPKLRAGMRAAAAGARCHIVDGREKHALRSVLEGAGAGTMVTA